jgi:hypothetical protein
MQQELDVFDKHDKEVREIIYLYKRLANQDVAQTYSNKPPLQSIASTMREMDPAFFRDLITAMKQVERVNPVNPGSFDIGR